jgi:two-component system NtrC family response regulator
MADKKVLIIDDEVSFATKLKEYLIKVGFNAIACTNGADALGVIESEKPFLITLDIRMPGVDGLDIMSKLRGKPDSPIIVVVSAIDTYEAKEDLLRRGAKKLFHKPVDLADLAACIKDLSSQVPK